jgi:two-component system OmpR family response regulator
MARILVVDDEPKLRNFVDRALVGKGYVVDSTGDGTQGLELARTGNYGLVILDVNMPGLDGPSVLRRLMGDVPEQRVLMLSAAGDVQTKVQCLNLGAADYLAKPFSVAELLARVSARLREPSGQRADRYVRKGTITVDTARRRASVAGGTDVELTQREFVLLTHLMQADGEVCSREELLSDVWGYSFDPGTNVVEVCIRRLRAKLGPGIIETVRNVGYRVQSS